MVKFSELPDRPARWLAPDLQLVRQILYVGSFVIVAMITQFMVNAADGIMVGRLPPDEATASQAALGLGMPLFWAIGGFFAAISYGTQALTARRFGEDDDGRAGQVLFNSLVVAVAAGLIGSAVAWIVAPYAVHFFAESSDAQQELATEYAKIRAFGIAGVVLTFSYKSFFDGLGRTHVHLIAALAMNVFNIGLNYLMIFGAPSMGIEKGGLAGSAWASTISTYVGCTMMFLVSLAPRYRKVFQFYRTAHWDPGVMRDIVRLALPSGSATVFLMTGFLLFMKFVGQLDAQVGAGTNTNAAATTALFNTAAFVAMPVMAFGTATATAVSQSLGAGKVDLAARYGWEAVRVGVLAVTVLSALFLIYPQEVIAIWAPHDPAVQVAAVSPLRLIASALPMMVVGLVLSQALYGAGANAYVMKVEAILHAGVLVPLSWFLGPHLGWGLTGAWMAAFIYANALGLAMLIKFAGRGWRSIRL